MVSRMGKASAQIGIENLRIADAITVLSVHRNGSVSAAARELDVTPSQVTKALGRMERQTRTMLFDRSARGLALTDAGAQLLPTLRALVDTARGLLEKTQPGSHRLTIAAPSFLCDAYLPMLAAAVAPSSVRGLEVGPDFIRAYAGGTLFQVAMTQAEERLPSAWITEKIGDFRKGLFASPSLAAKLGGKVTESTVRDYPFVCPVYLNNGELFFGNDDCPIPIGERIRGHEACTFGAALEMATTSPQLAFGPVCTAQSLVQSGSLVEVRVRGWDVRGQLYLHVQSERVLGHVWKRIVRTLRAALLEEGKS